MKKLLLCICLSAGFLGIKAQHNGDKPATAQVFAAGKDYDAAVKLLQEGESQMRAGQKNNLNAIADKVKALAAPVLKKNPNDIEWNILMGHSYLLRMGANSNYEADKTKAREYLYKADQLDRKNPRATLLYSEFQYLQLRNMEGVNLKVRPLFAATLQLFKEEQGVHPTWGVADAQYYYDLLK